MQAAQSRMGLRDRRAARASAVLALLLAAATVVCGLALGRGATASRPAVARSQPAIAIVASPKLQTLETKVVGKLDGRTHRLEPTLLLGTARFTITVTNPSPLEFTGVTVDDPLSPGCNRSIGTLAPGASIAYVCSASNVGMNYTNTVTVSGQWPKGARALAEAQATGTATAGATVTVVVKPPIKKSHVPHLAFTG